MCVCVCGDDDETVRAVCSFDRCASMNTCVYIYVYIYTYRWDKRGMYVCIYVCVYIRMYVCMYIVLAALCIMHALLYAY